MAANNSKKAAAILLAACLIFCLCCCGNQSSKEAEVSVPAKIESSQAPQAESKAPAPAESAVSKEEPKAPTRPKPADKKPKSEVEPISMQKEQHNSYEWEDDKLLVLSELKTATLWSDSAQKYPQLAESMNQLAVMAKRTMEYEFENLCANAREQMAMANVIPDKATSTLDIQVRRADSVVLSLLSDSYADFGNIEDFRAMHGSCYDAQTGEQLAINDIVDVNNDLAEAVLKELNSHLLTGEPFADSAVEEYFANAVYDDLKWSLDYNGVTFYFGDGDIAEEGSGSQTATVSFAEYPKLFKEKFTAVPDAYMVELPLDSPYFTDLDGNGDLEQLIVSGYFDSGANSYSKFGIFTDAEGSYKYFDCFADKFSPYYVKTAEGNFLYIFCEQSEGFEAGALLKVFDISGGKVVEVGEKNAAPGFVPSGIFRVPTDPNCFYLDDFDSMAQDMMAYYVGANGMPVLKDSANE